MLRILFLVGNPASNANFDPAKQLDPIFARLRASSLSTRVEEKVIWDVTLDDLVTQLRQFAPNVLHLCGHGSAIGEPIIVGTSGRAVALALGPLADLITRLGIKLKCVVLNACNTDNQVAALAEVADCTVAMKLPIRESSAALFASAFYTALASGDSVRSAFNLARSHLQAAKKLDFDVPVLRERQGVDASQVFLVRGLEAFALYDRKDADLYEDLHMYLRPLERTGLLTVSGLHELPVGSAEDQQIEQLLRRADVFLLLLTHRFVGSDACMELAEVALRRRNLGSAALVPIQVRDCDWRKTSFGGLKPLPDLSGPIFAKNRNVDEAWLEVVSGLTTVLKTWEMQLMAQAKTLLTAPPPMAVAPPAVPPHAEPTAAPPQLPKPDAEII